MCEQEVYIERRPLGLAIFAGSFSTGYVRVSTPAQRTETEDEVLAAALYLDRHGMVEEAEDLLDKYCTCH